MIYKKQIEREGKRGRGDTPRPRVSPSARLPISVSPVPFSPFPLFPLRIICLRKFKGESR